MASLRDIRKRIKSASSTAKITKAMKMVSASKLRRAQEEVKKARPYAVKLDEVIAHLTMRLQAQGEGVHPLLAKRSRKKKVEVLVLTSDRGLCGGFNGNIIRKSQRYIFDNQNNFEEIRISTIGKKGNDALRRANFDIRTNYEGVLAKPSFLKATEIATEMCNSFVNDKLDAVWLVYNEFKSAISQEVVIKQMLPVVPAKIKEGNVAVDYLYEPNQKDLLSHLVPRHFATKLFQAFLESLASEHGARMTAMDNAVRNAEDMISGLTLTYNRVRQAAITKELMEIISGAEAL